MVQRLIYHLIIDGLRSVGKESEKAVRAKTLQVSLSTMKAVRKIYAATLIFLVAAVVYALALFQCIRLIFSGIATGVWGDVWTIEFLLYFVLLAGATLAMAWTFSERRWLEAFKIPEQISFIEKKKSVSTREIELLAPLIETVVEKKMNEVLAARDYQREQDLIKGMKKTITTPRAVNE